MKVQTRSVKKRLYAGAIAALSLVFIACGALFGWHQRVLADSHQSTDGTLVTIYDRDSEQTIVTKGATVGDALKDAHISLDKDDVVEPATSQKFEARSYQVNIYRARPVLVIDGAIRDRIMTAHQTPAQIAKDAGITLYPEDVATLTQSSNMVADGAGLVLTITPATPLTLVLYGQPVQLRTQATTVGELLKEKSITVGPNDALSSPEDAPITSGMTLQLWHNGLSTINVTEAIPYDTQVIDDADQPVGYVSVTTPGTAGSRTVTYTIDTENGVEVSRTQIQSVVTAQPTTQVEVHGVEGAAISPTENMTASWNFLLAHGFSRYQTAGIMGNMMQEHHFLTSQAAGGLGIVQWTGSRASALLAYASAHGEDPYAIETQLEYMMIELNGGYSSVKNQLLGATSVESAVTIFETGYEKCNPTYCNTSQRIQYAEDILASL